MLEGLEATQKKLSQVQEDNLTFRLDSEYYDSSYLRLIDAVSLLKTEKLADLAEWITQGPNPVFSEGSTIPCLTGRNISKGRVIYENADYISASEYKVLKRFQLRKGDTLITLKGKGAIGKIGFVTSDTKAIFSRNIGIVRPSKRINPAYLNAYILSKYGHGLVLRGETGGTGQSTLTCSYLKGLDIPRLENEDEIGNLVLYSEEVLNEANEIYSSAESYLLECLGMQDFVANPDAYNIKTLKESFLESGRIDAEYYLPKYEDLTLFIQNYSLGSLPLSDIVDFYRGSLISDTYYTDYDVARPAYIRGGDISSNRMVADNMVSISSDFFPSEETICTEGDIVMAMIGSVGTASIVTQDFSGSYISNNLGLLRLRNHSIRAEVLHLYLTSPIGKMFFTQRQMVTAQPKIAFRDIENIPIPLIRPEVQAEIAQHIQRSFALRKEASQLLEEAKLSVEQAIEIGGNLLIYNGLQERVSQEERLAMYLLLKDLGLLEEKSSHSKVVATEKKLSASFFASGRLDAEYYQPKYDYLDIQLSQLPTQRLGAIVDIRKSIEPGSEAYQAEGIPFVRVSDLNKFGLEIPSVCLDRATYATAPRPQKDTILLSKDGSVGIAYKVEEDMDVITSGAILHLSVKEKGIQPDYLTLVLNSPIVKMQAERDAGGSIIQHWKPSEIEQVVIPILAPDIQQKLSEQVSKSFALRREAGALLAEAKAMVERAIEATA